ncbi:glycosyltransferase family 2 protein [Zobellia galactanivorans]|uniref:Glycosyltransferase, family GT2 n=1 Tax=Zobellia galactanivorans (strain DSM 12802 / CCUG 47099 / CIP 106680 / NCIMB 13871 / Dsij) TaxID=63186 RepID=G0LBG2_ZOBGA|nr:glycosyltransferase family 2 protein [Zobellia galactanivorans]MDO6809976.1 glycosyltransferase family 2 protein [Zobellia galactanivorans]CAZ96074.1 Glycosyltransferase, family GT2 [Zobellia galactanivorans]
MSSEIKNNQKKPLVSVILPAYNEEAIIEKNIVRLYDYLDTLNHLYEWEIIVVNDGSVDRTGVIADTLSDTYSNLIVLHHVVNRNLGTALRTGFANSTGDYVVVLDIDLSYSPDHIGNLLSEIIVTQSDMVLASPYMKGGKNTAVPRLRLLLSKTVNKMMQTASRLDICTFTGMVRAYKGEFIRSLNTKSSTFDINSEILLKAYILRARIIEIPAHLDWSEQQQLAETRTSSLKIVKGIFNGLANSFMFRPYMFFWVLGFLISLPSLYLIAWIFIDAYRIYPTIVDLAPDFGHRFALAVSEVYKQRPYSFIIGGTTIIVTIQLLSLGFISLQKKRYFDELFHINSSILKSTIKNQRPNHE